MLAERAACHYLLSCPDSNRAWIRPNDAREFCGPCWGEPLRFRGIIAPLDARSNVKRNLCRRRVDRWRQPPV